MAKTLVTVEEYKTYKEIKGDSDDNTITSLVLSVSEFIKNYCGRTFVDYENTPKTEYWSKGGSCVFLSEFPIISITSVNESDDNQQTQTLLTEDTDFYVNPDLGYFETANGSCFKEKINYVEVVYTGGYKEVPADLKLAAFHIIDYYRKGEYTQRKTLGVNTVEQIEIDKMPVHIKQLLDQYKGNI